MQESERIKLYLVIGGILLALVVGFQEGCRIHEPTLPKKITLGANENASIVIGRNTGISATVVRNGGTFQGLPSLPSARYSHKTTIAVGLDAITGKQTIKIETKTKGLSAAPGIALFITDRLRVGPDVQIIYDGPWALGAGIVSDSHWSVRAFVALHYQVYDNTWLCAGVDSDKNIGLGVRLGF